MIIDNCKNCRYFKPVKELVNKEWHWFNVCIALLKYKDGFDLVVTDDDFCEMFSNKVTND